MHPKASHAYRPPRLLLAFGLLEFILPACLAALLIIGGTCVAQPRMRTAAADSNATRALANFFPIEQNSTDVFRWSRWEATLRLWGFEQSAPIVVRMRLSAQREPGQPPAMLTVAGAGAAVPITSPGWRRYMFALPPPARGDQAPAVVLHSSPAQFASDPRELGVALAWVEASQYPGSVLQRLPDPRRVAFLTLLVLLLGGAARSAGASKRAAQSAMLGAALLLAIGIAAAPEALAYWLPNLWLALLTGWLALALPPVLRALRAQVAARPSAAAGCGLLAVAAAQALLPLGQRWSSGLGWALLVGGGLLLVAGLPRALPRAETTLPQRAVALALGATTLLALALRLAALDSLPLGMWRDEARHGLLALRILNDPSYRPVYVPVIADIPALLFYLDTVPIAMFGPHAWAVRLVPALAGALTPLALYFVARPWFGARVALLASFLLAVSVWHVGISRLGFAATLGPPLTLLAIGLFWRGLAPGPAARRFAQAALAGGCAGLAVYAYHPSRLTPLVAALTVAALLGRDWRAWRAALPRLALAATIGLLVLLPLIRYAVGNQAGYSRRVGQTFLLTSDESAGQAPAWLVEQNGRQIAGMWNERGDTNARHNLANTPMLDPICATAGCAPCWPGWL